MHTCNKRMSGAIGASVEEIGYQEVSLCVYLCALCVHINAIHCSHYTPTQLRVLSSEEEHRVLHPSHPTRARVSFQRQ